MLMTPSTTSLRNLPTSHLHDQLPPRHQEPDPSPTKQQRDREHSYQLQIHPLQTAKLHYQFDIYNGLPVTPSSKVKSFIVTLDNTLLSESHIKTTTWTAFFHLRNISRLQPSLLHSSTETLIHAFVTSRLDYRNTCLNGIP